MKKIIIVRHGETKWNQCGKFQGHLDSPLTSKGVDQINSLAGSLIEDNVNLIYSSPLGRAIETSHIIAERLSVNICFDSRLKERNLGFMEGLAGAEVVKACINGCSLQSIESMLNFRERINNCFKDVLLSSYETILIVTHEGVINNFPKSEEGNFWITRKSI